MKQKMLANLEGEGDDGDEERQEERATIEDTIRITDEALARKDREMAELKSRLAEGCHAPPDRERGGRELIDADEIIAEHRARIAQLENEMHGQAAGGGAGALRRAGEDHARDGAPGRAQGRDRLAPCERRRTRTPCRATPQHPKRRWLSKLGLSGGRGRE